MSTYRAIGARLANFALVTIQKLLGHAGVIVTRNKAAGIVPAVLRHAIGVTTRRPSLSRQLIRALTRSSPSHLRALSMGIWANAGALRRHAFSRVTSRRPLIASAHKLATNGDMLRALRTILTPIAASDGYDAYPRTFAAYELGSNIAVGCNGAVYEARVRPSLDERSFFEPAALERTLYFPLVVKMLFNYDLSSTPSTIVRDSEQELVPVVDRTLHGMMKWCRPLTRRHANITPVCTAFVDIMPLLPDAMQLYPAAIPPQTPADIRLPGMGENSQPLHTMFLVMKRYSMTLREYVLLHDNTLSENMHKRTVLVAQLFEAIAFLYEQRVAHRDLKSDNILLQLDEVDATPHLLVTDFGCCLAPRHNTYDMRVFYTDDNVDLGGNASLRAPEIRTAKPSERVDFGRADLWAAGALAHEIYTGINPFYRQLSSADYIVEQVPCLGGSVPAPVRRMIDDVLQRSPDQRPCHAVAANVVALTLAFAFDVVTALQLIRKQLLLGDTDTPSTDVSITPMHDVLAMFACETLMGRRRQVSPAEYQLRRTFLHRVTVDSLQATIDTYFLSKFRTHFVHTVL